MADAAPARSELFSYAERYVEQLAARDPIVATELGVEGFDHLLPEFTSERFDDDAGFTAASLKELHGIEPIDAIDRVCAAVMDERLTRAGVLETAGEVQRTWGVLDSPISTVRQVFELMADETADDRATMEARLRQVRPCMASWREGLDDLATRGELPPRRHVLGVADQAATFGSGTYEAFVEARSGGAPTDDGLRLAARDADLACGEVAAFLRGLGTKATDKEPCGAERHARWAQYFTGATIDLNELYEWGWDDLTRINSRMWELAATLAPDATRLDEVAAVLDADDEGAVMGVDALLERLEAFTQGAVASLNGVHFEIDPTVQRCDARIAPEGSAAAPYYIPPTEDLSRPGTTWFPTLGRDRFPWWRIASTWYHEGVPGHHLQHAYSLLAIDRQSRFQRTVAWTSGYGEGWALYAERLMEELGGFENPADELGYLEGQGLRAARIVVDLGLHLELAAPKDLGELGDLGDCSGRTWTPQMAVALLEERAIQDHEVAVSEVDRYLSLPAQAISYKAGERVWLAAREDARARLGSRFSLKDFHAYSLRLGPMGLDPFRDEMARWDGA